MDETAMAFEMPQVRAAASAGAGPLDRISVRDHVREVEIGAFRSERGVTQRIRFNVVLEVSHHAAAQDDDVDQVISYDTILDAIEALLRIERINLLETLAERIAGRCLADPRAVRVFVRIEKLDRIPGALGVEIVRSRVGGEAARLRPVAPASEAGPAPRPRVVHLAAKAATGAAATAWLDALVGWDRPLVLCLDPVTPQPQAAAEADLRIGLLSIEQSAWAVAGRDPRFAVATTRTELDWALRNGRLSVWAPAKMLTDAVPRPALDASDPCALAAWLAAELSAETLVLAGPGGSPPGTAAGIPVARVRSPRDVARLD